MSDVPVTLQLMVDPTWQVGYRVQVYSDFGGGEIDTDRPLLQRPFGLFPTDVKPAGWGVDPFGEVPFAGGTPGAVDGGWGREAFAEATFAESEDLIEVTVYVPDACGLHKFGVQVLDAEGNPQGELIDTEAVVSGREPAKPASFAFSSYDKPSDTVTFAFGV